VRFAVTAADLSKARSIVARLPLEDRAASVLMVSSADLVGTTLLSDNHFGGIIVMASQGVADGTKAGTPAEVLALTTEWRHQAAADPAGVPPLIGTDQEYGDVVRLVNGFTEFPGQSVLGSIPDLDTASTLTGQVARAAAQELLAVGISVDFAPVSDVLPADGDSGIGDRSFGDDPQRDAALVAAAVSGLQDAGVAATLKHFPGLGRVPQDTHVTLPTLAVSCSSWDSYEAVPLRAGIKAGVAMVMTGHVQLPAVGAVGPPASLSATVVTDLLRGKGQDGCTGLQFGGVTVSDSLQMVPVANAYSSGQAAVLALQAGEDLLLMPVRPQAAVAGIVAAVNDGSLSVARLDDAAARVLALRLAAARIPRPPLTVIDSAAHRQLATAAKNAARPKGQ
jgi:beta-N-acetylhexosaminidase